MQMLSRRIRLTNRADLAGVLALYRELRPNDPVLTCAEAESAWNTVLGDPALSVIVATDDAAIVSTCTLGVVPTLANGGRPFGVIEHVITTRTHRRMGFARAVLEFALNMAWSRQCYKVVLLSGADRDDAHRLYESVGFRGEIERGFVAKPDGV